MHSSLPAADYDAELGATEEAHQQPCAEEICPDCGSAAVSLREYSPWSLIPSIMFLLPVFFRKKGMVCKECGASWKGNDWQRHSLEMPCLPL